MSHMNVYNDLESLKIYLTLDFIFENTICNIFSPNFNLDVQLNILSLINFSFYYRNSCIFFNVHSTNKNNKLKYICI